VRIAVRCACLALAALTFAGCGGAEILVCREVSEAGVCGEPKSEIAVGRPYRVLIRDGVPDRGVLVIEHFRNGRAVEIGRAPVARPGAGFLSNPLMVLDVGAYRLTLRDEHGKALAYGHFRAPRPSVSNARTVTPADVPRP
jgi:hypothetical protein